MQNYLFYEKHLNTLDHILVLGEIHSSLLIFSKPCTTWYEAEIRQANKGDRM